MARVTDAEGLRNGGHGEDFGGVEGQRVEGHHAARQAGDEGRQAGGNLSVDQRGQQVGQVVVQAGRLRGGRDQRGQALGAGAQQVGQALHGVALLHGVVADHRLGGVVDALGQRQQLLLDLAPAGVGGGVGSSSRVMPL